MEECTEYINNAGPINANLVINDKNFICKVKSFFWKQFIFLSTYICSLFTFSKAK